MTAEQPDALAQEFVAFSLEAGALRFGDFTTKAGRASPYFFNTGLFDDGAKLARLGQFYARRLLASGIAFDMLFGPAYKGITLAAAVAIGLAQEGRNVPYAYNRKEAKDHGEGGTLVGAPIRGRVLIIDDVITDGASKGEAAELIRAAGGEPVGVAITMDRQERARDDAADPRSGVQWVEQALGLRVVAIATLDDLMHTLATTGDAALAANAARVAAYRARWGIHA
ncbi:MAG: orotate phosphoribosyltransferase [Proteobacteria bacterium]|nr:orotate phosphoribosyltransferase [Pseudomonadota bacterium]